MNTRMTIVALLAGILLAACPAWAQTGKPAAKPDRPVRIEMKAPFVVEFAWDPAKVKFGKAEAEAIVQKLRPGSRHRPGRGWTTVSSLSYEPLTDESDRTDGSLAIWARGRFIGSVNAIIDAPRITPSAGASSGLGGSMMADMRGLGSRAAGPSMAFSPVSEQKVKNDLLRRRQEYVKKLEREVESWMNDVLTQEGKAEYDLARAEYRVSTKKVGDATRAQSEARKPLESKLREMKMEMVAKEARLGAIRKQLSLLSLKAADRMAGDPIIKQLTDILAIRERQLATLRKLERDGRSGFGKGDEAEAKLAEVKIQIAQRKEALSDIVGGGLLTKLNVEQTMLSIDLEETQARIRFLDQEIRITGMVRRSLADRHEGLKKRLKDATPWQTVRLVANGEVVRTETPAEPAPRQGQPTGRLPMSPPGGGMGMGRSARGR